MAEYLKVKDYTYLEYCDYLQNKYGIGLDDYMTKSYNAKASCKRTKEGLIAHHKKEDTAIMLSTKEYAARHPFEWQQKENIVYCDYLEHLLLHILICKYPSAEKVDSVKVGYGGVVNFLVPELNDLYSGWEPSQCWRKNCYDKVKNDKDVYLKLLKQFIDSESNDPNFDVFILYSSFNDPCTLLDKVYYEHSYGVSLLNRNSDVSSGTWNRSRNYSLFKEIEMLYKRPLGDC